MESVRSDILQVLRRVGRWQAGLLETEDGELWHPVDVLLGAADEIEYLRGVAGVEGRSVPCLTVRAGRAPDSDPRPGRRAGPPHA